MQSPSVRRIDRASARPRTARAPRSSSETRSRRAAIRAREQHRDPVEAERESAVRRRAGAQPLEQEAEPLLRLRLGDAEQPEDPALQPGIAMRMLPPPSSVPFSTMS